MKEKKRLNDKEIRIVEAIHRFGGAMSPHEISKITGISYVTVRKYVEKLDSERILIPVPIPSWLYEREYLGKKTSKNRNTLLFTKAEGVRKKALKESPIREGKAYGRSNTSKYSINYALIMGTTYDEKKRRRK